MRPVERLWCACFGARSVMESGKGMIFPILALVLGPLDPPLVESTQAGLRVSSADAPQTLLGL